MYTRQYIAGITFKFIHINLCIADINSKNGMYHVCTDS